MNKNIANMNSIKNSLYIKYSNKIYKKYETIASLAHFQLFLLFHQRCIAGMIKTHIITKVTAETGSEKIFWSIAYNPPKIATKNITTAKIIKPMINI